MRILLFYKNSTYGRYFLPSCSHGVRQTRTSYEKRFKATHEKHFQTLKQVEDFLKSEKIKFKKACRGASIDFKNHDLVITIGGDGTFLEAAHQLKQQVILGINSDPDWSVGRFCYGHPQNFKGLLDNILNGHASLKQFHRLRLSFDNSPGKRGPAIDILNDVLVCHQNPAAISYYDLRIGKIKEEQKSSGIWIATAAGSTGAVYSAHGKILPEGLKNYQYKPRELYKARGRRYLLKGGLVDYREKITIVSLMQEGVCFLDGSHLCLPFSFSSTMNISHSPNPLNIVVS